MTDTERLDWLVESEGNLVNNDAGQWAVAMAGFHAVPLPGDEAGDMTITHWVSSGEWRSDIRSAIDAAIEKEKEIME